MTSAALTPAASASVRRPTPKPCSPNCSIAASRIRATAVKSAERMFSTLNARSADVKELDLDRRPTPVDAEHRAPDVGGVIACQEQHCSGHLLGSAHPTGRDPDQHRPHMVGKLKLAFGGDRPGRDGVDS